MKFKISKNFKEKLPVFSFILSVCLLFYAWGVVSTIFRLFPYPLVETGFRQFQRIVPYEQIPHHLFPIQFSQSGVTLIDREKMMPGITLITSYWKETGWTPGIRIIDAEGTTLHHWEIMPEEIWPESPYVDHIKNSKNTNENYVHGTFLYPDGDIVFNIEYLGLVRMNSAGKIIWKLPYRTHHSVFHDEEGNFWVCGMKWIEDESARKERFPELQTPFTEETILQVSPEGKLLKEISLLESLYYSDYKYLLWHYGRQKGDLLHLNDVEVLESNTARQFPIFEAGDLIVSALKLSIIAVLDKTGKIKWLSSGIFTKQHDPDYEDNGWITVFDNRTGLKESRIRAIHPASRDIVQLYPLEDDQHFYTPHGGKQQKLSNGNRLITEAGTGRAFEITRGGEIVWEWIQQPYNLKHVPEVLEATRYYLDEKVISEWKRN